MCSVGDLPEIDMKEAHRSLKPKDYECLDCGRRFKGIGENVKCISCRSGNVRRLRLNPHQSHTQAPAGTTSGAS